MNRAHVWGLQAGLVLILLLAATAPALGSHSLVVNRTVVGCGEGIAITVTAPAAASGPTSYRLVVTAPPAQVQLKMSDGATTVTSTNNTVVIPNLAAGGSNVTWLNATGTIFGFTINATNLTASDPGPPNITATYDCLPRLTPAFPVNFNYTNGAFFNPPGAFVGTGGIPVKVTVLPNSTSPSAGAAVGQVFAQLENASGNVTVTNTTLAPIGADTYTGTVILPPGVEDGNYSLIFIAKTANIDETNTNNTSSNRTGVATGGAAGTFHIQIDREPPHRPNVTSPNATFTGPLPGNLINVYREWKSWPDGSNNSSNRSWGSGIDEFRVIATTSATCDETDVGARVGMVSVTNNASSVSFDVSTKDNVTLYFCVTYTRDRAGNVNDTSTFAISNITRTTFDFTPPEVNFTDFPGNSTPFINGTSTGSLSYNFFARDRTSGVGGMRVRLTGAATSVVTNYTCSNTTNAFGQNNASCTVTWSALPNGDYTINVEALDNVGNNNSTATRTFRYDRSLAAAPAPAPQGGCCLSGPTTTTTSAPPPPQPVVETQAILVIQPFTPATFTFTRTAITGLTLETRALQAATSVTVTQHLSRPPEVSVPPGAAAVAAYLSVETKNIFKEDIAKATLRFTVERKWLDQNNLSEGQVALARHDDAKKSWSTFPATKVKEEKGVLTFESTVPGLSVFAIIAQPAPPLPEPAPTAPPAATPAAPTRAVATPPPAVATPPPTPAPATPPGVASPPPPARSPGFEALAAVAALGAALAVARRRGS